MQKQTDCIFIFAPGKESRESSFDYHLGAGYIISLLKSNGFSAHQFILKEPAILTNCAGKILECRPKIAGFTVYNTNFISSVLIAEHIKKISPRTLIVFGGPSSSVHYEFIMSTYHFVDACFLNDSEETFLQFVNKLSESHFEYDKTDLSEIKGVTFRSGCDTFNNPAIVKAVYKGCRNYLDKFPSPYLTGNIPAEEGRHTGILTSRGCNQNCVYCNCAVLSGRKVLFHSVDRVVSELDLISQSAGNRGIINFQDDTFTLYPERAREICTEIIRNRIHARLTCVTRCDSMDETLLDVMKEAGFISLIFSLETNSPVILRRIGKVHAAEDFPSDGLKKEIMFLESFERVAAYAKKIGFKNITTSVMIGLPGETISQANKTIEAVDRNKNIDHYSHNFLKIFKGTPLSHNYEKYGYKLSLVNNNPLFVKMVYPADYAGKVFISPKSHLHSQKEDNDKSTLGILSLTSGEKTVVPGFRNIILLSDHVQVRFVKWLKDVLAINGTIIQLYSGERAMTRLRDINYERLIKYSSPSLDIRSYFLKETRDAGVLLSPDSLLLKINEDDEIRICGFDYFRSGLDDPAISFIKTSCREAGYTDSVDAHSFLCGVNGKKDPFSFFMGKKTLPYFSNICKWTRDNANCVNRNTLLVNEKGEVRFCWHGGFAGSVGNSYNAIINNLESEIVEAKIRRECAGCKEETNCIKCPYPYPMPEEEYCRKKKTTDTGPTAELIIGLDQIKQIFY